MNRNSRFGGPDKTIQTVCVGDVYVIDKREGYDRRRKMYKWPKEYDRRLCNWAKNFKRRRQAIDIIVKIYKPSI